MNLLLLTQLFLAASTRFEAVEPHMGTLVHIVAYAPSKQRAADAFQKAFARITELDGILSDYMPGSELNRLCRVRTIHASRDLFTVLNEAQRMARESDGGFDITAGPMIRLWREARQTRQLPDKEVLERARQQAGWRNLTLDHRSHFVTLTGGAGMQLDAGGLAKGYVAGEAAKVLRAAGIQDGLVAASGDIVAFGRRRWPVTLELLDGTRDILLHNAAVSTAGDTEQFVEIGGVRYSHIIDPHTGMALTNRIAVAVVSKAGLEADALDTTIAVVGPGKGLELLRRHHRGVAALIVSGTGAVEFNSKAWGKLNAPAGQLH